MTEDNAFILAKQRVKTGETIKVWSNLLVDSIIIKAPLVPEGALYSLYEVVTPENRHGGWFWEMEKEIKR